VPTEEKITQVEELKKELDGVTSLIFTDYRGLKVQEIQELRRRLRARGIRYQVVKNTLLRRAATESGLPDLQKLLEGPTAIATGDRDEVELAKGIVEEARILKALTIDGGVVSGRLVSAEEIQSLAALPNRAELQGTIVGTLQAPLSQLASTLEAPLRQLVYVFAARSARG
jgi:large subunit ribosomal protein L10